MVAMNRVFILPLVAGGVALICAVIMKNTRYGASTESEQRQAKPKSIEEPFPEPKSSEKTENETV